MNEYEIAGRVQAANEIYLQMGRVGSFEFGINRQSVLKLAHRLVRLLESLPQDEPEPEASPSSTVKVRLG